MKAVLGILLRELDHLLRAIENINTDHGIHGYLPWLASREAGPRQ